MKDYIIKLIDACETRTQILDIITASAMNKSISNSEYCTIYIRAINKLKTI